MRIPRQSQPSEEREDATATSRKKKEQNKTNRLTKKTLRLFLLTFDGIRFSALESPAVSTFLQLIS